MQNDWIIPVVSLVFGALAGYGGAVLKLGRYAQMVDDLKERMGNAENKLSEMSIKITECVTKIDERTRSYANTLTQRKSPISLSDVGENLLKRSGADRYVLENQENLVDKIKEKEPKSAYDVQEIAKEVVQALEQDERIIPLKDFAYKEGLELESIFIVMAIYLRDIALPLLDYRPEDVDQSEPKKIVT